VNVPRRRHDFLDPGSDAEVRRLSAMLRDLRPLEGERVSDAEEAVASMASRDEGEEVRRMRRELLRVVAGREASPLLAHIDAEDLRVALFSSVWERGQPTGMVGDDLFSGDPQSLFASIANRFAIDAANVAEALFADTPGERLLVLPKGESPVVAQSAARAINLERLRQRLRRAVRLVLEIPAATDGDVSYVPLLWGAKRLGLMYDAEVLRSSVFLDVAGPYALFGKTTMYGNRLFEFAMLALRHAGRAWKLTCELLLKEGAGQSTMTTLRLDASMRTLFDGGDSGESHPVRSGDEEAFQKYFARIQTPWRLAYEGALILLDGHGRRVPMIPDFVARSADSPDEVFVEIVGFWRRDYLARKIDKVARFGDRRLLLIVNSKLALAREAIRSLETDRVKVFFYDGREELKLAAEAVAKELEGGVHGDRR